MKHKVSITLLLLSMFLLTQAIGLYVVAKYTHQELPLGLQLQEEDAEPTFASLLVSFVIAFAIIFILMKYRWKFIMKLWFFIVVTLALTISLNAIFGGNNLASMSTIAIIIAIPLALLKIYRPHVITHNVTELLVYPGIGAIFVQLLNPGTIIGLLVLISLYDMWAVWSSGIMQKMAKFQMEELSIFGGFLLPTASKKVRTQIKNLREKYKGKKIPKSVQKKKFKVSLAILGGGDVVFPIIASGVFLRAYGLIPALLVMLGAFAGLAFLFSVTKKDRAYPAMPYISVGIFLGMLAAKLWFM